MTLNQPQHERWRQLALIAVVQLLAMSLWFSATAVAPQLELLWKLDSGDLAWLTNSVQIGFVLGALGSAALNLSDRFEAPRLLSGCAVLGALCNGAIALLISDEAGQTPLGFSAVVMLRMLTGVALAGVYPPGMKLMASWFVRGRGLAIGVVVGALTIGSASPHLLKTLPVDRWAESLGLSGWRVLLLIASALAVVAAIVAVRFAKTGPHLPKASQFDWKYFMKIWQQPSLRRANLGYLGHMFELYAMWAWAPKMIGESYAACGWSDNTAYIAGFGLVAIGGVGSVAAGVIADRVGRTRVTIVSLAISGSCALVAGFLFDSPVLLTCVCLVWGLAVVADSAQFSAAVSELCQASHVGTALTIQTCAGFLLTTVTIRLVPEIQSLVGWGPAMAVLAAGPVVGIWQMSRLRAMGEASKMASGNR